MAKFYSAKTNTTVITDWTRYKIQIYKGNKLVDNHIKFTGENRVHPKRLNDFSGFTKTDNNIFNEYVNAYWPCKITLNYESNGKKVGTVSKNGAIKWSR